jgi:RNA polymerase sigma factor (sigma-70 family)
MPDTRTTRAALVIAAQGGDRRSLSDLMATHLPLVYTIVRRALSGHPDVDDLVQDIMLRAVRELHGLRAPESFRPWLAAIAMHQIGTYLHQRRLAIGRTAPLEEAEGAGDAGADVERMTELQLELSDQRGEVVRASAWLDPDDRVLLGWWWLEVVGEVTRHELAHELGVSVPHAGVRVQRMRTQVDLSRSIVAALEARPRCPRLDAVLRGWDGQPGPMWRKRLARHVRGCGYCQRMAGARVALDRLLVGSVLLPVPAALAAAVAARLPFAAAAARSAATVASVVGPGATANGAGAAKAGLLAELGRAALAHPVAAFFLVGTLVAGGGLMVANWSGGAGGPAYRPRVAQPVVIPATSTSAPTTFALGPTSIEAANRSGFFVSTTNSFGTLAGVGPGSASQDRERATFDVVSGLADPGCFSFRLADGRYLRHASWRLRVFADDGSALFRGDATFCVRLGVLNGSVSLESSNYPGWFLHQRGAELWVDHADGTEAFGVASSFRIRSPLAG